MGYSLSKPRRIVQQIRELCAILSGLVLATDYKQGQELFQDRDFKGNEMFFQQLFELGRRYKIMNPDKMRSTYGKLIYLLQVCFFSTVFLGFQRRICSPGQSIAGSPRPSQLFLYQSYQDRLQHLRGTRGYGHPPRRSHCHRHEGDHIGRTFKEGYST